MGKFQKWSPQQQEEEEQHQVCLDLTASPQIKRPESTTELPSRCFIALSSLRSAPSGMPPRGTKQTAEEEEAFQLAPLFFPLPKYDVARILAF